MMRMPAHGAHLRDIAWKFPRFSRRVSGRYGYGITFLCSQWTQTYGERLRNTVQLETLLKKNLVCVFRKRGYGIDGRYHSLLELVFQAYPCAPISEVLRTI
jgi:hypothetical protein